MRRNSSLIRDESGAITAMTVILLAAFLGLMALVVDLGQLFIVQNELGNAADACALRGARAFLPDNLTGLTAMAPDQDRAKTEASLTIVNNRSDDRALTDLPVADIQVGLWNCETRDWVGGAPVWDWPPDSSLWGHYVGPGIGLPTKKTTSYNAGPVVMTLAKVFGIATVPVGAKAIGYLSPIGGFTPESPVLPFGTWPDLGNDPLKPGKEIHGRFRNDSTDTLGWTNLDPDNTNPNANEIKKILKGSATIDCPCESTVGIQNGVASSAIQTMIAPNNRFGLVESTTEPNVYKPQGTYADAVYMIPVFYAPAIADKFTQSSVVGAVSVKLVSVSGPPDNTIELVVVEGPYSSPGYGGGAYYGVLSTVPKLVQ